MPYKPKIRFNHNQQRDVERPLTTRSKDRGLYAFSHGLQRIADEKVHTGQRYRKAGDAQEGSAQGAGSVLPG